MPLNLNSLGIAERAYMLTDTLGSESTFTYEVVGVLKDGRKEVLDRERVGLNYKARSSNQQVLNFSLDYRDGIDLQILLLDRKDERVLRQSTFKYNKALDSQKSIFVGNYVKAGTVNFTVRVINLKTHQKIDHVFFVSPEGKVLKK